MASATFDPSVLGKLFTDLQKVVTDVAAAQPDVAALVTDFLQLFSTKLAHAHAAAATGAINWGNVIAALKTALSLLMILLGGDTPPVMSATDGKDCNPKALVACAIRCLQEATACLP